jgi:capsular exopolysaccharide synthesis family protein
VEKNNRNSADKLQIERKNFQIREAYKTARTNIAYSIIKKGCKKVAFTSTSQGEGKTSTAINVAVALSEQVNTKVLIVECDLRRPFIHTLLQLDPSPGIVNYLNDEYELAHIIRKTKYKQLNAVCYGAIPPNPSELLSSEGMTNFIKEVEKSYDYIIFDNPPIGVVVDAIPIIKISDGVVVVAKNNSTTYPEMNRTLETIKRSGGKTLGIIVNQVKPTESKKYKKYGYRGYNGYYSYDLE